MTGLQIMCCSTCRTAVFPDRLRCPECGADLMRVPAGPGTLEEQTTVLRPAPREGDEVRIGSVRLDAGPVLIARLDSRTHPRARVSIERYRDGSLWARQE